MSADWSREEIELIVEDYLDMLAAELSGVAYNKASHRRRLSDHLRDRSEGSIEFKHANISAALIDLQFPYIAGYKPAATTRALFSTPSRNTCRGARNCSRLQPTTPSAEWLYLRLMTFWPC